jgi:radical SAM family uncharacterized protein
MPVNISNQLLQKVEKPAAYIGGEYNSVVKDKDKVNIRFAFCFPDTYEIGMSHLGMKILYHILNRQEDIWCERVFAPKVDMEEVMRAEGIPLYGLESKDPLTEFDFLGFTLQYEMCYTNVLNMLDLGKVPLFSKDRTEEHPFVLAGGSCTYNPEPVADFFDFFVLGEGEEVILEIMDAYTRWKNQKGKRKDFLKSISSIQGVYVPCFYDFEYNSDGTISKRVKEDFAPDVIRKRIVKDFDAAEYLTNDIVPFIEPVHDRVVLELFRGCIRGCRFCQAGFVYRPVREKKADTLIKQALDLLDCTGHSEVALTSLSTSDYTQLAEFTEKLTEETEKRKVNLSLPSLRVDSFSLDLMEKTQKVRKSGLTFAPEAGTQRLRDVINKNISEEDILNAVKIAQSGGYTTIKLYFMLGLPGETLEDVEGIAQLTEKITDIYKESENKKLYGRLSITVSTSYFVPKPFTPFQWVPQIEKEEYVKRQQHLEKLLKKNKKVRYNWHHGDMSVLEAVMARGDRSIAKAIYKAWESGCKFDSWNEHFNYEKWVKAFKECGIDPAFFSMRERGKEEILPWDHIDIGVSRKYLWREYEKAKAGETTPDCRTLCTGCGAVSFGGGVCYE